MVVMATRSKRAKTRNVSTRQNAVAGSNPADVVADAIELAKAQTAAKTNRKRGRK
jgi:hypothetical protein